MKTLLLSLALSALAQPVLALSCLRPDVARSFNEAAAAKESYVIVQGRLTFDTSRLPKTDLGAQEEIPPHVDIAARLTGMSLSKQGFTSDFDHPVTLRVQCFGPWCGGAASGAQYLSFLEKTDTGYMLTVTPCGGFGFAEPSREILETVSACFQNGRCAETSD